MGGSSKSTSVQEQRLPPWVEEAARENLDIANEVFAMGYTPNFTPSVAAMTPMQENAALATNSAAQAFGLPSANFKQANRQRRMDEQPLLTREEQLSMLLGMPPPVTTEGGFRGYSTEPVYNESLEYLAGRFPAQEAMRRSFTMDPVTGAIPQNPTVPAPRYRLGAGRVNDPISDEINRRSDPFLTRRLDEIEARERRDKIRREQMNTR
jgi:hypothetical protein